MAYKTRNELLTQTYADNSTGAIVAQSHRDFVESSMVYGDLVMAEDLAFSVTGTPRKLEFTQNQFAYGMTANTTAWQFENMQEGHYMMTLGVDISLAGNNVTYTLQLFVDGAPYAASFGYNTRDDSLRLSRSFIMPQLVNSDAGTVDVRISSSGGQTISIYSASWIMYRLGSN